MAATTQKALSILLQIATAEPGLTEPGRRAAEALRRAIERT